MMNEDDGTDEENRGTLRGGEHDDDHGRDRDNEGGGGGGSDGGSSSEEEESSGSSSEEEEEEEEEIDPSLCMMAVVQYRDVFAALQDERIFDKFPIGDAAKTLESLLRLKVTTPGENLIEAFLKLHNGEDQGTKRNGQQAQEDQQGQGQDHGNNNNENQQSSIMNNIIDFPVIVEVCYLLGFDCPQTPVHRRNPHAVRCLSPRRGNYRHRRPVTLAYAVDVLIRLLRCLGDIHGRTTASYTKRNLFDDFQLLMDMNPQNRQAVLDLFDQSLTVAAEQRNRGGGGDGGESLICKAWPAKFILFVQTQIDFEWETQIGSELDERDFLSVAGILVANHHLWGDDYELVDVVGGFFDGIGWNEDGRIVRMGKREGRKIGKSAVTLPVFYDSSSREGTYRWPCPSSFSNLTALQELHLKGCTSLVSIPNLKKLYLKDTVLDKKCLQDLCFPQLEFLLIEANAKTRDNDVSGKLVSKDISPCLKYFKLLGILISEEDDISCFASLASCTIPKTLMRVEVYLDVVPRQALGTLLVDLAPKLGDQCEIKVGIVGAEKIRWLANKLQSAPPINIRYLMFHCSPTWDGDEENWKAFEYIADKCNAVFLHWGRDHSVIKAAKSHHHKTLIRYAGNDLLDPNDITNIRDSKKLPISVWPTILERADQKSNIQHIWDRIMNGPPDPELVGGTGNDDGNVAGRNRSTVHSGLFHLLRYGPILSHLSGDVGYEKKKTLKDGSDIENGDGDDEPTTMTMKRKSCASSTSRSATGSNLEKKARNT